ncbi:MAG: hypothetical protein LBN02_06145 [Oscillospiraceae bacterium]|jgi:hypothetical protein|nr:hypothetical protein [Oscillospiraceae bacterium]
MTHGLRISTKPPPNGGLLGVRRVCIRERVLRRLFGEKQRLTILVPGDSVDEIEIYEKKEDATT